MVAGKARQIIIDDTDPDIQYKGRWCWGSADTCPFKHYSPSYNNTLHQINNHGSISYTFNGTSISVIGAIADTDMSMGGNPSSKALKCSIDRTPIPIKTRNNNWVLCEQHGISDGKHKLRVHFNSTGAFDSILYTPSPGLSFETANVLVYNSDPGINFSLNWTYPNMSMSRLTRVSNSTATLNFTGTAVSWFGSNRGSVMQDANALYTIDGGPPTSFKLHYHHTNFSHELFTTPNFQPGSHTLVVTFEGNGSTVPLSLDYLVVANTSTPSTEPAMQKPPTVPEKHRPPVGAIVGGVVGGLFFVTAFVLFVFWWHRRRERSRESREITENGPPPSYTARAPVVSSYPAHPFSHSDPHRLSSASSFGRPSLALSGYTPDTVAQTRALRKCQEVGLHPVRPPSLPYPEDKENIGGDDVVRTKSPTQSQAEIGGG
ncbi:hypothetical protein BDZ94DRAFT_1312929 [Collybia nuda]|uniref:Transmembrane protein n=1 Tax=Collybia nuda TaxID=64659 RepID=A0A9P6CAX2_9AGAR|nr:hypothetical protein BDZ94DRAFT_1312929 [Collybia nuda]